MYEKKKLQKKFSPRVMDQFFKPELWTNLSLELWTKFHPQITYLHTVQNIIRQFVQDIWDLCTGLN
jgi:hypothetical protein